VTLAGIRSDAWPLVLAVLIASAVGYAIAADKWLYAAVPFMAPLAVAAFMRPVIGLCAMFVFIPIEGWGSVIPESVTLPKLIGFLTFGCFAANLIAMKKPLKVDMSVRWFTALIVFIFFSTFWAQDKEAAYFLTWVLFQMFLLYVLCINLLDQPEHLRWALLAYLMGCVFSAGMALQNFNNEEFATSTLSRVSSVEGMNPNDFGRMMGFGLIAGLFLLFDQSAKWMRWAVAAIYPILALGLVLSKGRGAWMAFIVAMAVVFWRVKKTVRVYAAAAIVIMLTLLTGAIGIHYGYFDETFEERWNETVEGGDPTAQRVDIWRVGFALIRDNPIAGVGVNNFKSRFNDYLFTVRVEVFPGYDKDAHNIFISMLGDVGIVGFTMFMGLFATAIYGIRRAGMTWPAAVATAIIAFLFVAGFSSTDYIRKWFWIALATGVLLARRKDDHAYPPA
jgi:O-antigen ligase